MTAFHEIPAIGPCAERAAAMQALVPVIETERLVLRAPTLDDFQPLAEILTGPQGAGWGLTSDREGAWHCFLQVTATWYLRGSGAWILVRKDTGQVIGVSQISPEPGDYEHEIGWILAAEAEGQGFAAEAAAAVRDHGIKEMRLPSLVSYIAADNARSVALAQRLGAVQDPPPGWPHADTLVYRHHPKAVP